MEIQFNGVDATTGQYLVPPLAASDLARQIIRPEKPGPFHSTLKAVWRKLSHPFLGLAPGVDPTDLRQAGWAIVFLRDEDDAVKRAMAPLVEHRRQQIGNDAIVKTLEYRPGETRDQWLSRYHVAPGAIVPEQVPYYVLVVGDPARVPFEFCHELDVEYGVGLLHFDAPEQYSQYAASVIAYETAGTVPTRKEATFFGTRHPFDGATQMSADYLVTPLANGHADANGAVAPGVTDRRGFRKCLYCGPAATKARLADVLAPAAGGSRPALLFTASHGMGWPKGDAGQRAGQGALLCQDWPGVGTISSDHFFAAADLPAQASVHGLIAFHFACFGAGTPQTDQYMHSPGEAPPEIADAAFVAALPKALLSHRNGGALACIGHVERAWGYSLSRPGDGTQLQMFEYALERLLLGQPAGYALKDFNERYAALSVSLADTLQQAGYGRQVPDDDLAEEWIRRNDSGGYLLIGDPAVRLRVADLA